jgi:hypothetical protein
MVFVFLTCILGGGVAWLAGRALAVGWRSPLLVVGYMLLLTLALRFFHYSLFGGSFSFSTWPAGAGFGLPVPSASTLYYYLVDAVVIVASALLSWRLKRASQMVTQYYWLYRRVTPFSWTSR